MRYDTLFRKHVRVISVVVYRNGRLIKTEYYGDLIDIEDNHIVLREKDFTIVKVEKRFIRRIEEWENEERS